MKIETKYSKLSESDIKQWEDNNISIPNVYRKFLLHFNGGTTGGKNTFKVPKMKGEFGFNEFFGIHGGTEGLDYVINTYVKRHRFPDTYFAIGSDVSGNLVLIGTSPENLEKIFFWYHENESDEGKKATQKNIFKLADSLQDFIDNLYEETPISYGELSDIYSGNDEGIKKLLSTDWEVNTPDELGSTLIQRAVVSNKVWLVKELITRNANLEGTIEKAIIHNNVEITELLLKGGANPEERNSKNDTLLQLAVLYNKPAIVSLLLKYKADKNVLDSFGDTLLQIAHFKKNRGVDMDEVIKLLQQ